MVVMDGTASTADVSDLASRFGFQASSDLGNKFWLANSCDDIFKPKPKPIIGGPAPDNDEEAATL